MQQTLQGTALLTKVGRVGWDTLSAPRQRMQEGRNDRPYRSDGIRGRGSFSGRSVGRGSGQERDRDMSSRGRAQGAPRGGYAGPTNIDGASNSNSGNGGGDGGGGASNRHADGQGGSAAGRPSRHGANTGSGPYHRNGPTAVTPA